MALAKTVLILGANGRFGRHAQTAFLSAGWTVKRFDRHKDDLEEAARESAVIVNAWNPPYPQWAEDLPYIHEKVRKAALAADATVILPGNVYVFGREMPAVLTEETSHAARNPLGVLRAEIEADYRTEGVRTILLRAGDFLDTEPTGGWFDRIIAARIEKGRLVYPGPLDRTHAWAWLPDLTAAAVTLAERRDSLPRFAEFGFEGFNLTGEALLQAVQNALHRSLSISQMNWLPLQMARPFWPMAKHLLELRYLWEVPHQIDGSALRRAIKMQWQTPLEDALVFALGRDIDPDQVMAAS